MKEFVKRGHEVTMFTVSKDYKWRTKTRFLNGLRIIEGPNFFYKFFGYGWDALDLIIKIKNIFLEEYDLVYASEHQPITSWPVYLTKKIKKYKFISDWCDWHSGASNKFRGIKLAHKIDGYFEEKIRFKADAVLVNNRSLMQRAISIGVPRNRIFLM